MGSRNTSSRLSDFFQILGLELKNPVTYLASAVVGLTINCVQSGDPIKSFVPYIVPMVVQLLTKTSLRFSSRHRERLLLLPAMRDEPAFIMGMDGKVVASIGNTALLFKQHNICSIRDFLSADSAQEVLDAAIRTADSNTFEVKTVLSDVLNKNYTIKIKGLKNCSYVLVWMENVTEREQMGLFLGQMFRFADQEIDSLMDETTRHSTYDRLAELLLARGYSGLFITRQNKDCLLGNVYKVVSGEVVKSGAMEVFEKSNAPVWESRHLGKMVAEKKVPDETCEAFSKRFPFDTGVLDFLGEPVENFVNYHSGEVSLIAFNGSHSFQKNELRSFETAVNFARALTFLVDLADSNEKRFQQSITGLCAAAEFSDEITGNHIHRVNLYSGFLAEKLGMDDLFIKTISTVASMHDIGKVAIPHIIKLNRKLTSQERAAMQTHTIIGARIIEKMIAEGTGHDASLTMAKNIALHHHQHWDGSGYPALSPNQLSSVASIVPSDILTQGVDTQVDEQPVSGTDIPIEARIVALADVYDALRSPRQYKPEFSHEKACAIIEKDDRTGTSGADAFGADLMAIFSEQHLKMKEIYDNNG